MRWIVLVLVLIACVAFVFYSLTDGGSTTPEVGAASSVASARAADPERHEPQSRADAELEGEAVERSISSRTEAALPTTRLEIRIVDESGSAKAGIRLRLFRREHLYLHGRVGRPGEDRPWIRTTDAKGLAVWDGLEPGEDWHWAPYSDLVDYEPAPIGEEIGLSGSFALKLGETTRLSGRLVPTLSIVGQVQDGDSKPLSGFRVTALRRDALSRSVVMTATTDAEGRFTLRRVRIVPLRLECVAFDVPGLLALVTHDVDPVPVEQLDVGVLKLAGRSLRVALRAIDAAGRDVTALAAAEDGRSIPVEVEGCGEFPQQIRVPLGGSFRMIGFECRGVRVGITQDPPRASCAPGWVIAWKRSFLDVGEGMEGDVDLDVPVMRAEEIAFTAPGIQRAGVPDQRGVAVLKVSLLSKDGPASIDFEMRALLGVSFDNTHSIPPGQYQLQATCEDEGALWTATRDVVVAEGASEAVRIDLVRVR